MRKMTTMKTEKVAKDLLALLISKRKKDPIHRLPPRNSLRNRQLQYCKSYFRVLKRQTSKYKNLTKTVQLKQI